MTTGTCTGWKEERGFGFVRPDEGGADIFVHRRNIANALWLREGQRVTFEVVNDGRSGKSRADNVRVV